MYSKLLENPRKRRRSRRRARRSNPGNPFAENPRRRRRGRRRSGRRRSSSRRRSNPFRLPGLGGGLGNVLGEGVKLHVAEIAGQVAIAGLKRVLPASIGERMFGVGRVVLGVIAPKVLRMLRMPSGFASTFGAVQVAQGIYNMTAAIRGQLLARVGLNDFVTVNGLAGDVDDDGSGDLSDDYGLQSLGWAEEPDESGALNDYVTEYA